MGVGGRVGVFARTHSRTLLGLALPPLYLHYPLLLPKVASCSSSLSLCRCPAHSQSRTRVRAECVLREDESRDACTNIYICALIPRPFHPILPFLFTQFSRFDALARRGSTLVPSNFGVVSTGDGTCPDTVRTPVDAARRFVPCVYRGFGRREGSGAPRGGGPPFF